MTGSMLVQTKTFSKVLVILEDKAVNPILEHYHAAKSRFEELIQSPSPNASEIHFLRCWIQSAEKQIKEFLEDNAKGNEPTKEESEKGSIVVHNGLDTLRARLAEIAARKNESGGNQNEENTHQNTEDFKYESKGHMSPPEELT